MISGVYEEVGSNPRQLHTQNKRTKVLCHTLARKSRLSRSCVCTLIVEKMLRSGVAYKNVFLAHTLITFLSLSTSRSDCL